MNSTLTTVSSLGDQELLDSTRAAVRRSTDVEADLLALLAEVEARKLYLERAFPTMFDYCVGELGMSEGIVATRLYVAHLARRLPAVLDEVRSGRIHLSGLRLLAPYLDPSNQAELFAEAAGKSKRAIELIVARLDPRPAVPASLRKLPTPRAASTPAPEPMPAALPPPPALLTPPPAPLPLPRAEVEPLSADTYKLTLTIDSTLRAKLKEAEDLLRPRVRRGDYATIVEQALDLLIAQAKKVKAGIGATPRRKVQKPFVPGEGTEGTPPVSEHIPVDLRRAVWERDGGQCAYLSEDGRRCPETGGLHFDHLDGFAITREHHADRICLKCAPHNGHAAEQMYGKAKMARMKNSSGAPCSGAFV